MAADQPTYKGRKFEIVGYDLDQEKVELCSSDGDTVLVHEEELLGHEQKIKEEKTLGKVLRLLQEHTFEEQDRILRVVNDVLFL